MIFTYIFHFSETREIHRFYSNKVYVHDPRKDPGLEKHNLTHLLHSVIYYNRVIISCLELVSRTGADELIRPNVTIGPRAKSCGNRGM